MEFLKRCAKFYNLRNGSIWNSRKRNILNNFTFQCKILFTRKKKVERKFNARILICS